MENTNCPITINIDDQQFYSIDFDKIKKHYIVKLEDKTFKMTRKGVLMFFIQRIQNLWDDAISMITFECCSIERYILVETEFIEYKNDIEKHINFFLEFQLETFL